MSGAGPGRTARSLPAALLLVAAPLLSEAHPAAQYFDLARGLAGDKVWDLESDALGGLWVATTSGVSRFDGERFRTYDVRDGLPSANVIALARLRDGRIVAGTSAGIATLDPVGEAPGPAWRQVPSPVERGGGQFVALAEDAGGVLWAGGNRGLFRFAGAPGAERLLAEPLPVRDGTLRGLAPTASGDLDLVVDADLYRRHRDGRWSGPWALPETLVDVAGIGDLAHDAAGRLWATSRRAVCVLPAAAGEPPFRFAVAPLALGDLSAERFAAGFCLDVEGGLPPTRFRRGLTVLADGRVLVSGEGGVLELGAAGARRRADFHGLGGGTSIAAFEASDRTLWIGTNDRGLARLPSSGFEIHGDVASLGGAVSSLVEADDGLLVVTDLLDRSRALSRLGGSSATRVSPPGFDSLRPSWGWGAVAAVTGDGALWIGREGGLVRYPSRADGRFGAAGAVPEALADALAGHDPFRLFRARDGALWISSHEPPDLLRFDPATASVARASEIAGLGRGGPSSFVEAPDGTLFCGFYQGSIARRRPGGAFSPLAGAAPAASGFVYALALDAGGSLWAGAGDGLVRCRSALDEAPRCEKAAPGSEIDHLQIYGLAVLDDGAILAATTRGLFSHAPGSGRIEWWTRSDGLPGNNVTQMLVAANGGIWLVADGGVARFVPPPARRPPEPARIVALSVAGSPRALPPAGVAELSGVVLSPDRRFVELEVAAIALDSGPSPLYQWRLGGSDWTAPARERRLSLAGLESGTLVVEARSISSSGIASSRGARLELEILPPFYRRAWFLGTVALLLGLAAWLAHRARVARLIGLERVRTRIAADLHDDLGSSLSRISILAEVARRQGGERPEIEATLSTIGETARELGEMTSDIVWAIDPRRDDLASLIARLRRFGSDLFEGSGTSFAIVAPDTAATLRLEAAARRDLYLLLKEALANAAKHAKASAVRIHVERRGGRIHVEVADDGHGFGEDASAAAAARGGGNGLRTMRERAARLGGELAIDSRPGSGTRLVFDLPV